MHWIRSPAFRFLVSGVRILSRCVTTVFALVGEARALQAPSELARLRPVGAVRLKPHASPLPMELRQLRYFVRVVELGSMGRAAAELGVVVSGLSQQISRLEGELATRLLQRSAAGVRPTDAARCAGDRRRQRRAVRRADRARGRRQRAAAGSGAARMARRQLGMHTRNLRCMHDAPQDVLVDAYPEEEFWQDLLKVTGG
jgi:hypothetical protein